ncbi:MAG: ribosome maturation factor RimM [Methylovirgula sp.]
MTLDRAALPASRTRVLVGRIGAAHGIKGEVRLVSFTAEPKAVGAYGPLNDESGTRRFDIAALRPLKDNIFIAKFAGVTTREAAEALNNIDLYLPRPVLPAATEDEFYHADLIGLAALDSAGAEIGRVTGVLNFGGGDILEIAPAGGGETLLLPFTRACVPSIDLAQKRLVVVPPVEIEAAEGKDMDTFR